MLLNKSNWNWEWLTLVGIVSIVSYSGKQHGKSLPGQMAQSIQANETAQEGDRSHELTQPVWLGTKQASW